MNFRRKILTGIGALAFVVLLALNMQLVQNIAPQQSSVSLSLIENAAIAQGEYDCFYPDENWNPVVSCGQYDGCCWIRNAVQDCDWTGSPQDWCKPYV